ncbi:site-specific integrase [Proteobacteria bacterium 005FR1]|nr:site-specific integrase [Proteobacteria bacterium 005FR1]
MPLKLLLKRHNVYHFRWQVPPRLRPILGRRELTRSLRTEDLEIALLRVQPLKRWIEKVKSVTEENLEEVVDMLEELLGQEPFLAVKKASMLEVELRHARMWLESYQEIRRCLALGLETDTLDTSETFSSAASGLQLDLQRLGFKVERDQLLNSRLLGRYVDLEIEQLDRKISALSGSPLSAPAQTNRPKSCQLSQIDVEDFLEDRSTKKPMGKGAQEGYRTAFRDLVFILGDLPLSDIGYDEARRVRDTLCKLPKHRNKQEKYANKSAQELLDMKLPTDKCIGATTIADRLTYLKTIFDWFVTRGLIETNPFTKVGIAYKKKPTADFKAEELNLIFSSALYQPGSPYSKRTTACHWWFPLVSLFTGARPGELMQTRLSDMKYFSGILCIKIPDEEGFKVKNKAAPRAIPVHPVLLELGFVDYLEKLSSLGYKRVFETIPLGKDKVSERVSKWFNEQYRPSHLPKYFKEKEKKLYSFRHTYITECRVYAKVDRVSGEIMAGHEVSDEIEQATYVHRTEVYHLERLVPGYYREQCKLRFEGVDFTHLKDGWQYLKLKKRKQRTLKA